ncbi:MAG TPA: amidase family protein [Acidimicrobiales bacterium]|nr:amidase family protein [Acidimicrobiales bacterium]
MAGDDLAFRTARDLAAAVAAKEVSSRELLDLFVARAERLDESVHAVVTFDVDRARVAASAADDAMARGESFGPLHGLPITIKDAVETEGIPSTGGAVELTDHVPATDAPAVARLKAAGAIVYGKTNLPRWSGDLQSYNEIFGTTNNPWDATRVPGGSSGGPAAAVAAGLTSFELGTDIGGSIRIPSHFCGTFGLKPSFGVVPQRGYLDRVGGGLTDSDINVFGPMARSSDDLELLLGVLAGPEPERTPAWRIELPASSITSLAGVRIGVWLDDPFCTIDAPYRDVLHTTVDRLADAGAKIEEAHPPVDMAEQVALFNALILPAISPSLPDEIADSMSGSHLQWLRLQDQRQAVIRTWARWFASGFDALLCPVTPTAAFPHNQEGDMFSRTLTINGVERSYLDNVSWTGLIGIVELPSAVPPLPRTRDGLPVGVQVVTPFLQDRAAIRLAGLIAEASGGGYSPPPLAR